MVFQFAHPRLVCVSCLRIFHREGGFRKVIRSTTQHFSKAKQEEHPPKKQNPQTQRKEHFSKTRIRIPAAKEEPKRNIKEEQPRRRPKTSKTQNMSQRTAKRKPSQFWKNPMKKKSSVKRLKKMTNHKTTSIKPRVSP